MFRVRRKCCFQTRGKFQKSLIFQGVFHEQADRFLRRRHHDPDHRHRFGQRPPAVLLDQGQEVRLPEGQRRSDRHRRRWQACAPVPSGTPPAPREREGMHR